MDYVDSVALMTDKQTRRTCCLSLSLIKFSRSSYLSLTLSYLPKLRNVAVTQFTVVGVLIKTLVSVKKIDTISHALIVTLIQPLISSFCGADHSTIKPVNTNSLPRKDEISESFK